MYKRQVERNAFLNQGMEFGRAAYEKYERLEEAKRFLQDMMQDRLKIYVKLCGSSLPGGVLLQLSVQKWVWP